LIFISCLIIGFCKPKTLEGSGFYFRKISLIILFYCYPGVQSFCQSDNVVLLVIPEGITNKNIFLIDSARVQLYLDSLMQDLRFQGYVHATVDSTCFRADSCFASVYKGNKFQIKKFRLSAYQADFLRGSDIQPFYLEGNSVDSAKIQTFLMGTATFLANHGYPFSGINLDSLTFNGNEVSATLVVSRGPLIVFDSLQTEGKLSINKSFLSRFLKIKPGNIYNHSLVEDIPKKLNGLVFVRQNKKPSLLFDNQSASVLLDLDPLPASRFDFIVGLLPSQRDGVRSLLLTGDFNAELHNIMGAGEYNFLQFKRLRPTVVELQLKSSVPYLGKLPFGAHFDFRIFKNQNANLDLFFDGGLQYLYGGANQLKVYYSHRSSSLIDVDTSQIRLSNKLPGGLDMRYSGLGAGIVLRNTDNIFSPTRGLFLSINASAGYRRVLENRLITGLAGFENAYDSLLLSTVQVECNAQLNHFSSLSRRFVLKTGFQTGLKLNERSLITNEYLRIGGSKLLRGFDEESIFTSGFVVLTGELRFLLDRYSYISFPFVDFGYARVSENNESRLKLYTGTGLGLNFNTKAGVFAIALASGRTGIGLPDFGSARVHFGFQSIF
jgi:outer membrane protein assembly factor BamA